MMQQPINVDQLSRWRISLVAGLVLVTFSFILWAGIVTWQNTCGQLSTFKRTVDLICPSSIPVLVPLLVALGFWSVSLVIWYVRPSNLAVEFFLVTAGVLASGLLSAWEHQTGLRFFYILLVWFSPVAIHFHYNLSGYSPGPQMRIILSSCYGLALLSSLPLIVWDVPSLQQSGWFKVIRLEIRLYLILALMLVLLSLFWNHRRDTTLATRRHMRLVSFGTFLAFAPLLFLSLLPDTLQSPLLVPYKFTFPWLLLSPLIYVYSLLRQRLTRLETWLIRAAVFYLLAVILLGGALLLATVLTEGAAESARIWMLFGLLIGIGLLVLVVIPLQQGLTRVLNWIFYGGELDHAGLMARLAEALALTLDQETLQQLLVEQLPVKMQFQGSALYLQNETNSLVLLSTIGFEAADSLPNNLSAEGRLAIYLAAIGEPVSTEQARQTLASTTLQSEERLLLDLDNLAFWLPLVSSGSLHGVLLVGNKLGVDFFTAQDRRIFKGVAHQAGIAAHNVRLIDQVRAGRSELAQAHRQLLVGREQERRRLAHALHDGAVQQLLGISYQLVESRRLANLSGDQRQPEQVDTLLVEARREILTVVSQLRSLIGEMRPAGLEELGLTAALEGYVACLQRERGGPPPLIYLDLDQSGTLLPEPVAICLFRVAQEALRNALKHAQAEQIDLRLRLLKQEAILTVRDDGCGFCVPTRLSVLTHNQHFGLVGMAERVKWSAGCLSIDSQPGQGTQVRVRVPLTVAASAGT